MTGSVVSPAMRQRVRDLATPVARFLGRLGLTPNALTVIGFVGTCVAAAAAASQAWLLAGLLVLVFGIFDLFDGTLARATGRVTKFGAFLDSTFDRAGEAIVYVGIAAGAIVSAPQTAILAAAAMAASFMVSYTRAKSESLGFTSGTGMASVGLAPREVRLVLLAAGLVIADQLRHQSTDLAFGALDGALFLITALATITTIQRILHVRAQSREG